MRRIVSFLALLLLLVAAVACGNGDKPSTANRNDAGAAPTSTATATGDDADEPSDGTDSSDMEPTSADTNPLGGVFSTLFEGALTGPDLFAGDAQIGEGDPALLDYVLKAGEFPSGFTPFGEFTFRVPDGISEGGGVDMAASMAYSGDIESDVPAEGGGFIMSMVLRPDDLTALGDMFESTGELSEQELRDALMQGTGEIPGFGFKDVQVLDTDGLGEGAFGFALTMDLSGIAEAFGGFADATQTAEIDQIPEITMRMYMFGRGDYAGAIMQMAFGQGGAADADALALAKLIDAKLQAAP